MKIIFIGATGLLGKPVAKALSDAGHELTLLARNELKAKQLFPQLPVRRGDVFDVASLENAFRGFDAVYINLSVEQQSRKNEAQPEREGIDNILIAAKRTGMRRVIYLSSLIQRFQGMGGFRWWVFDLKQRAIKNIKESGIPYSIFYPSSFMDTFINLIKGNNLMIVSGSKQQMWFIAASDYGKQVAKALSIAGDLNQEYVIQGTESYTWDEAADLVIKNYRKTHLRITKAPLATLRFFSLFSPSIRYVANIIYALNNYPETFESKKTWDDLGKPQITLAEFASNL